MAVETAAKLAVRPHVAVGRTLDLVGELWKVALGLSAFTPAEEDPRFGDQAWRGNFLYRGVAQAYLAAVESLYGAIADLDLPRQTERRVRLAAENLVEALAPSNNPFLNPAVLKAVLDTGGGNLVTGAKRLVRDMAEPPRAPGRVRPRHGGAVTPPARR